MSHEIAIPPAAEHQRADMLLRPLESCATGLENEIEALGALRNALLPELISGQLRVPDTADIAEVVEPIAEAVAAS
jgi:hypothetical protein